MLAKAVATVPDPDSTKGGLRYEPKWDGFRGIVTIDGDDVEIGSRGAKPLTRYFPELVEAFRAQFGGRDHPVVLDGEVILRSGEPGAERLDWDALSQRIHPAASRIAKLSAETPAQFVAFDLLAVDGEELVDRPFDERRERLEQLGDAMTDPLFVTRTTLDVEQAREWLTTFEGAGLDGVVAKPERGRTNRTSARCSRSSTTAPPTSSPSATACTRAAPASGRCSSGCTTRTASSARSAASPPSPTSAGPR